MKNCLLKSGLLVVLGALLVFPTPESGGQEKKLSGKASAWMKTKLDLSQKILEGLTEGDFEKVSKNAKALHFLDYLEAWFRSARPDYKRQITQFDTAVQELIRQAKAKNTEGATLAYTQLTISCVQCHQIVRAAPKSAGSAKP